MSKILHILPIFIIFALVSCTAGRPMIATTTDSIRTDTVYIAKTAKDSVIVRDSVHLIERGDSVILTRIRDRWRTRTRTDTIYRTRCDTIRIRQPVEVEKIVTRTPTAAKILSGIGVIALLITGFICTARLWDK